MIKIIAIIVVMVVINAFMVYAIFKAANRVNEKVNKYFLHNLSEIVPASKTVVKEVEPEVKTEVVYEEVPVYKVDVEKDEAIYRNLDFKEDYKSIKEKMSFNRTEVIKDVMDANKLEADSLAKVAIDLSKAFDVDTIYNLSTMSSVDQEDILRGAFNNHQLDLLNDYKKISKDRFSCVQFFEYVNRIAKQEDPNFYVKTGWKEDYFDNLGDNVVTLHDESITEGVKIVHKDKVYDYSIQRRKEYIWKIT